MGLSPEIGRWYCSPNGMLFEVVAIDDVNDAIELQHFDGTLEETDIDDWLAMDADSAEAPEDWSGSFDLNHEDLATRWQPLIRDWQSEVEIADLNRSQITEIE